MTSMYRKSSHSTNLTTRAVLKTQQDGIRQIQVLLCTFGYENFAYGRFHTTMSIILSEPVGPVLLSLHMQRDTSVRRRRIIGMIVIMIDIHTCSHWCAHVIKYSSYDPVVVDQLAAGRRAWRIGCKKTTLETYQPAEFQNRMKCGLV